MHEKSGPHQNGSRDPKTAEKSPAYQWYPKDILSDTRVLAMSNEVEGIYRRLLDHAWLEDGLPADLGAIYPLCRLTSRRKFDQLWMQLEPFFPVSPDGRRRNRRQERERAKQRHNSEVRSQAAHKRHGRLPNGWSVEPLFAGDLQELCRALARANCCLAFALAIALADQDQKQKEQGARRARRPLRMSLSVWNAKRHLYKAAHLAIGQVADPRQIDIGAVTDAVKTAGAQLRVAWEQSREIALIVDGAIAQKTRQLETDRGRARLAQLDRQAMGGRYR